MTDVLGALHGQLAEAKFDADQQRQLKQMVMEQKDALAAAAGARVEELEALLESTPLLVDLLNTPVPDDTPELVSLSDAARRIGMTPQGLSKHYGNREENGFPAPIGKVGRTLVFRLDDIESWWGQRKVRRTTS